MCGIAGVRSFSPTDPIRADQIVQLLLASESRGKDATGLALQERETGKIVVYKDDSRAGTFVNLKPFEKFLEAHLSERTGIAILHTRASTSSGVGDNGTSRRMVNNHPMWKDRTAVVHNGCIHNHRYLFDDLKLERSCDTDSDILRAILDRDGLTPEGIKTLGRCAGGAAIAAISEDFPDTLLLARSGSPMVVGVAGEQLVFASERGTVHAGFRQHQKRFGIWVRPLQTAAAFTPFPSDTAWIFNKKECIGHWEFKTSYYSQSYHQKHSTYTPPKERESKRKAIIQVLDTDIMFRNYKCRSAPCTQLFDVTRKMAKDLSAFYCCRCGMLLDGSGFSEKGLKEIQSKGLVQ